MSIIEAKTEADSVESRPTDELITAPCRPRRIPSPIRMCIISDLLRAGLAAVQPVQPHGPDGLFVGNAGDIPRGLGARPSAGRAISEEAFQLSCLVSCPVVPSVAIVGMLVRLGSFGTAVICRRFVPSCRVGAAGPDSSSVGCLRRTKSPTR